ncbi:4-aminobutyrate--2-oxoglutarate transaminase [Xinfangfangia sp. D13-10-4-6]|uniref:4-aminobutyrate--2-oxoglutarate transaminase n=1 Tax=Pseudogemmobacter hezensis TaxID=2737662 RepID=UPI0015562E6A|nr:4-aminobutyrate--2-oxoglutarate transaminase [Pseudogemmobacter hezensis]NPD16772.1 4-aminobutyrate--2-oxoglutarate transaminase [Pseudogemmobacter hezensis]
MLDKASVTADRLAERSKNVPQGVLTAHPLVIDRAEGAHVWDIEGRDYLDFVGGIGVHNIGHNHPRVVAAVTAQLGKISHAAFQVAAYEPYLDLAARLNTLVGKGEDYKSVFFTTGAEAVENAVKIARAHTNRPGIVAFRGAFHGRTLLASTLTGFAAPYKQNFGPFAGEIYHSAYPNELHGITVEKALAALQTLFDTEVTPDRVAAIIIEPVQGDGGFLPAPAAFMQALREITQKHGIVLICDEIQTGFGRTGKMFGFEHSGIQPDLITTAKSLAGGLPLSGVVGRAAIMDAPKPGGLGGTYGGNALACAAALAVLDAFEHDGLLERAVALGERMAAGLSALVAKYDFVAEARGQGFMQAIEITGANNSPDPDRAQRVIDAARAGGLLIIKCGIHRNVVRFLAPIVVSDADLDRALSILDAALAAA